jgi:5-methyltetrahydropteroyltriglutamate--homocysteine methyltransferase
MRRDSWQTHFAKAVDGFDPEYPRMDLPGPDGTVTKVEMHFQIVNAKLRAKGRIGQRDVLFLKQHAPGPFKLTMPSPNLVARAGYRPGVTDLAYPLYQDLLNDVVTITREEMVALADDGTSYIQLDEGFAYYVSTLAQRLAKVQDLERALEADIAAENKCYDAVNGRTTVAMHICRGSRNSFSSADEKGYDWLAERLFNALHVDRFLLEYDLDYDAGFSPLRFMPKGKIAVLGLISTKTSRVESVDELCRRIDQASKYCPVDQLALTTQCGFQAAADRDGAHVDFAAQWQKLEVMMSTAHKVWKE